MRRRFEADEVLNKSVGTAGGFERILRHPKRRKALKGKAQECRELKEASEGGEVDLARRVAKPESGTSGERRQSPLTSPQP